MLHATEIKLGSKKGNPRIWNESRVRLSDAGFHVGTHFKMTTEQNKVTLEVCELGERMVSRKTKNDVISPVIDINASQLFESFGESMMGEMIYARFYNNKIVFTLPPVNEAIEERESKFFEQIKNGKPVDVVSLFTGSGFLDMAMKSGLEMSGIKSKTVFANELDERYLENGINNNPALKGAATVQGSISTLHRQELPQASVLQCGLPCVGFSKSGKTSNKIESELEHEAAGHLFIYLVSAILKVNPAILLIENTPEAIKSVTFGLIEKILVDNGYKIQKRIIDSRDFGALEQRKRMAFVAVSENVEFDIDLLEATGLGDIKVGDILDQDVPESAWSEMTYLKLKNERDTLSGKGFRLHTVNSQSNRVSTLGAGYWKIRSTESKLEHPVKSELLRQFTKDEHARIKGWSPDLVAGISSTIGHTVLGNGVVRHGFEALWQEMGNQIKQSVTKVSNSVSILEDKPLLKQATLF